MAQQTTTKKSFMARQFPFAAVWILSACLCFVAGLTPAHAQNQFAPALKVNDRVITAYELSQRTAFLGLLKAPGNTNELAKEQLINEALQRQTAQFAGIELTAEDLRSGMDEFTKRFNLGVEEFVLMIGNDGVARETFRDFVAAGLLWRQVVRQRFAGRISVTDQDIDREIALGAPSSGVQVLLSEIILAAQTPEQLVEATEQASKLSQLNTLTAFAVAARELSASPTRGRSGRLDWMALSKLPPAIGAKILPLAIGGVTEPLSMQNSIGVFQLRAIKEVAARTSNDTLIDYAILQLPADTQNTAQSQLDELRTKADQCNDLYGLYSQASENQLQRLTQQIKDIPTRFGLELAKLDQGEISPLLMSNAGHKNTVLMLCKRSPIADEEIDRETIRLRLQNQRLQSLANAYLEDLKAAANLQDYRK